MNKKIDLKKILQEIENEKGKIFLRSQKLSQMDIKEMLTRKKEERKK